MGILYKIACDDLQETIDPMAINGYGGKADVIANTSHPFGCIAVFAMLTRWKRVSIRLVNDQENETEFYHWKDATDELIEQYNSTYKCSLRFTGEDDE